MSPDRISRRTALSMGGVLVGLGVAGATAVEFASDDGSPGADGFTARTVPAGSDPLVLVDADGLGENDAATAALDGLLDASRFGDLPDALRGGFQTESGSENRVAGVGKVAFVGSDAAADAGAAVVWAAWTDDQLRTVLESSEGTESRAESYGNRTVYATDAASAAVLGDSEFALGTLAVVRDVVDAWHGDAEPVGGAVLRSFERTPREAEVRFAFGESGLARGGQDADSPASDRTAEVYDSVSGLYGSVPSGGDAVRLHLRIASDSDADAGEVATAVRRNLGLSGGDGTGNTSDGEEAKLPREAVNGVTVRHEHDFVAVEYSSPDGSSEFVGDVVEAAARLAGWSEL